MPLGKCAQPTPAVHDTTQPGGASPGSLDAKDEVLELNILSRSKSDITHNHHHQRYAARHLVTRQEVGFWTPQVNFVPTRQWLHDPEPSSTRKSRSSPENNTRDSSRFSNFTSCDSRDTESLASMASISSILFGSSASAITSTARRNSESQTEDHKQLCNKPTPFCSNNKGDDGRKGLVEAEKECVYAALGWTPPKDGSRLPLKPAAQGTHPQHENCAHKCTDGKNAKKAGRKGLCCTERTRRAGTRASSAAGRTLEPCRRPRMKHSKSLPIEEPGIDESVGIFALEV